MWCGASLWVWAAEPGTTTVYRSVDANGVVSFSDAPHASAVPIEVVPPRLPLQDDVERANARFEQQLALLELLETSRRARAKEDLEQQRIDLDFVRTEAAMQRAREREATQSSVQFFPWFPPFWGSPRPPGIHPPPIDRPPPPPPPPRRVPLPH
jgi:hypothetical protein